MNEKFSEMKTWKRNISFNFILLMWSAVNDNNPG